MNWELIAFITTLILGLIGTIVKLYADYMTLKKDVKDLEVKILEIETEIEAISKNTNTAITDVKNMLIAVTVKLDLIMTNFKMELTDNE